MAVRADEIQTLNVQAPLSPMSPGGVRLEVLQVEYAGSEHVEAHEKVSAMLEQGQEPKVVESPWEDSYLQVV